MSARLADCGQLIRSISVNLLGSLKYSNLEFRILQHTDTEVVYVGGLKLYLKGKAFRFREL